MWTPGGKKDVKGVKKAPSHKAMNVPKPRNRRSRGQRVLYSLDDPPWLSEAEEGEEEECEEEIPGEIPGYDLEASKEYGDIESVGEYDNDSFINDDSEESSSVDSSDDECVQQNKKRIRRRCVVSDSEEEYPQPVMCSVEEDQGVSYKRSISSDSEDDVIEPPVKLVKCGDKCDSDDMVKGTHCHHIDRKSSVKQTWVKSDKNYKYVCGSVMQNNVNEGDDKQMVKRSNPSKRKHSDPPVRHTDSDREGKRPLKKRPLKKRPLKRPDKVQKLKIAKATEQHCDTLSCCVTCPWAKVERGRD